MWAADRIEKLVPYLRRYARAATGDTQIGDASVERVLKQILVKALENELDEEDVTREAIFKQLEQRRLIKPVKSVTAKAKKLYMLYNLTPR